MVPRLQRSPEDRLRLAVASADYVLASPVLLGLAGQFGVSTRFSEGKASASVDEPEQRLLRDLTSEVRKFDSPRDDRYLAELYEVVRTWGVEPDWQAGFDDAQARYHAAQDFDERYRIGDPDIPRVELPTSDDPHAGVTWVRPREAFELWVYGGMLHDDYDKQLRFNRFDDVSRAFVRSMGHDYLMMLVAHVAFVGRLIRFGITPPLNPPPPPPRPQSDTQPSTDTPRARPGRRRCA